MLKIVHDVRQFLELILYYWRFVKYFVRISASLSDLLKKTDVKLRMKRFRSVIWNADCEFVFQILKKAMTTHSILIQSNRWWLFQIETDAFEWVIDCILLQLEADEKYHSITFDGRKLTEVKLNYSVHKKELLAIKHALQIWDRYINNDHITTMIMNHESLQYLQTIKTSSKRLARWISKFQKYSLEIRYWKELKTVVLDAISRRFNFMKERSANVAQGTLQ
jgi:hypothetical protein